MSTEKTAEQLAREWLETPIEECPSEVEQVTSLAALLEAYGTQVRKEAIAEALDMARTHVGHAKIDLELARPNRDVEWCEGCLEIAQDIVHDHHGSLATTRGAK